MALIKCANCSKEISDKSENCIHCGTSTISTKTKIAGDIIMVSLTVIANIITCIGFINYINNN